MALTDCSKCWMSEEHCTCNNSANTPAYNFITIASSPQVVPSRKAIEYAHYILNHYSRYSTEDKICLARDLETHGWKP